MYVLLNVIHHQMSHLQQNDSPKPQFITNKSDDSEINHITCLITCLIVILLDIVILIDTIDVESQFIKYDDSDNDIKNIKYLLCDVSRS